MCTSPGGPERASYPLHELMDRPEDEQFDVMTSIVDTRYTPGFLAAHPADQALVDMRRARRGEEKPAEVRRGEREQQAGARTPPADQQRGEQRRHQVHDQQDEHAYSRSR